MGDIRWREVAEDGALLVVAGAQMKAPTFGAPKWRILVAAPIADASAKSSSPISASVSLSGSTRARLPEETSVAEATNAGEPRVAAHRPFRVARVTLEHRPGEKRAE
jgi:hypothetical protein